MVVTGQGSGKDGHVPPSRTRRTRSAGSRLTRARGIGYRPAFGRRALVASANIRWWRWPRPTRWGGRGRTPRTRLARWAAGGRPAGWVPAGACLRDGGLLEEERGVGPVQRGADRLGV